MHACMRLYTTQLGHSLPTEERPYCHIWNCLFCCPRLSMETAGKIKSAQGFVKLTFLSAASLFFAASSWALWL